MDDIRVLEECVVKVEEVKEEVCDPCENGEYDILGNSCVKTEYCTSGLPVSEQKDSEEELKPLAAVYIKTEVEIEEGAEEQGPLALSDDVCFITPKRETEAGFCIPGDPDNKRDDDPSSENDSRPRRSSTLGPLQCTVCNKCFRCKSLYAMHMQEHTVEKPYQCTVCHVSFSFEGTLVKHFRTHTGEKPFECTICGKRFAHEESFLLHVQTVHPTGYTLFQCSVCKKQYSTKDRLVDHTRLHTADIRCSVCKKNFTKKTILVEHFRVHTGEKPFQCSLCKKCFSQRSTHLKHKCTQQRNDLSTLRAGNGLNEKRPSPLTCRPIEERDSTSVPYAKVALQRKTS